MKASLPSLLATSVVRGSEQGESHGGIFLIDFEQQQVTQCVDWNTCEIDFSGRGWDRGLRGIEFWQDTLWVAASDALICYDRKFKMIEEYRNPSLRHCHEICRRDHLLLLTSTGFDCLLGFDLNKRKFVWGLRIARDTKGWKTSAFDPLHTPGPKPANALHLNNVWVDSRGIYAAGLRVPALLHINAAWQVTEVCALPEGTHNARPFRDGVLFNDTQNDHLRFVGRGGLERAFPLPRYPDEDIEFAGVDDSKVARQAYGRGLCAVTDTLVAGGSSPSTISLYDLERGVRVAAVNLSMDIRNAIHGLEVWRFE